MTFFLEMIILSDDRLKGDVIGAGSQNMYQRESCVVEERD